MARSSPLNPDPTDTANSDSSYRSMWFRLADRRVYRRVNCPRVISLPTPFRFGYKLHHSLSSRIAVLKRSVDRLLPLLCVKAIGKANCFACDRGIEVGVCGPVSLDLDLSMAEPSDRRFVVGYALLPKKQQSFIRPSLVGTARDRGVDLVPIDPSRPLVEQGSFDCVIHKLHSNEWKIQMADFAAKNPGVPIVDQPFYNIERLHNRITMLQFVSEMDVPHGTETFGVPKHMLIDNPNSDAYNVYGMIDPHLRFPIIAKPLLCNSSDKSHRMSACLGSIPSTLGIKLPMVLQEFVNHGGIAFKVYVAGNDVQCVKRKSLPDIPPEFDECASPVTFCRVPNRPCQDPEDVEDDEDLEAAELPSSSFLEKIAMGLRKTTGLHLFNFDMIRDSNASNHYFIIDINYFPDYSKMPGYEEFVTNFFLDMVRQKRESAASSSSFITIF